jgi:prepilin-type N-terminal cleavage/methylation domain-containing protein
MRYRSIISPCSKRRAPGFTLVEMLMVVVVLGILLGITATRLDWQRYRADAVSRGVLAELAQAQRLAVSLQLDVRVTATDGVLQIHEDADNDGAVDSGERVRRVPLEHGYRFGRGGVATLPAPADGSELTTLAFRRDGSASRAGALYVAPPIVDSVGRYARAVTIARGTGRAVWYTHGTGTWQRRT